MSNPRSRAYNVFYRHMAPYDPDHPRYTATPAEYIEHVERTSVKNFSISSGVQ